MSYKILDGDCFDLIKDQPDNSVDLIITSPPYSDIINYGKEISIKKPNEYCDWFLPIFDEIQRVLKPSGSFILNINDNCKNGLRNPYIYELIYRSQKETKLKFYDTYIWHKLNGIPNGGKKRFRNNTEFIFHFVKDQKKVKWYMDRVLEEPAEATSKRAKYEESVTNHGEVKDGVRDNKQSISYDTLIENGIRPDNVFRFPTAGKARDNHIKHPAPYYRDLPEYFIKFLTDEGDTVIDIFSGIGTTGIPCLEMGREYIGYELNKDYADFSRQRLNNEKMDEWLVCQYDLDGKLIAKYKNRDEASKATGVESGDIMRTYNRTKFNSRGGYIWKLEKKDSLDNTNLLFTNDN